MKEKVRAAIIGTGKAAHMHAAVLKKNEKAEFVAVCSRKMESAKTFAASYGIQPFTNIAEMIGRLKVAMVIICTPHPFHREVTVESLRSGAHALVEKPLASTLKDCDAMIDAATEMTKKLGVVSQRRFFPASLRCKKAID